MNITTSRGMLWVGGWSPAKGQTKAARALGGQRFDGAWVFPLAKEAQVRKLTTPASPLFCDPAAEWITEPQGETR